MDKIRIHFAGDDEPRMFDSAHEALSFMNQLCESPMSYLVTQLSSMELEILVSEENRDDVTRLISML